MIAIHLRSFPASFTRKSFFFFTLQTASTWLCRNNELKTCFRSERLCWCHRQSEKEKWIFFWNFRDMIATHMRLFSESFKIKSFFFFTLPMAPTWPLWAKTCFLLIFLRSHAETVCKVKKKNDFLLKLPGNDLMWIAIVSWKFQKNIIFLCHFADGTNMATLIENMFFTHFSTKPRWDRL